MKNPVAGGKTSLPGPLAVKRVHGIPTVFPQEQGLVEESEDLLETIYDHGPVEVCSHGISSLVLLNAFLRIKLP